MVKSGLAGEVHRTQRVLYCVPNVTVENPVLAGASKDLHMTTLVVILSRGNLRLNRALDGRTDRYDDRFGRQHVANYVASRLLIDRCPQRYLFGNRPNSAGGD